MLTDVRDVAEAWTSASVYALLRGLSSLDDPELAQRFMNHAELCANMAEALCQDIGMMEP